MYIKVIFKLFGLILAIFVGGIAGAVAGPICVLNDNSNNNSSLNKIDDIL